MEKVNRFKGQDVFLFCRLQEKHNREKLRDHLKSMVDTQEELKEVQARVKELQTKIKEAHSRQERLIDSSSRLAWVNIQFESISLQ